MRKTNFQLPKLGKDYKKMFTQANIGEKIGKKDATWVKKIIAKNIIVIALLLYLRLKQSNESFFFSD